MIDCFGPPVFSDVLLTRAEAWHEEIVDFVGGNRQPGLKLSKSNIETRKKKEENFLFAVHFISVAVTGGLLPITQNTVVKFGHCDPEEIFSSVCAP